MNDYNLPAPFRLAKISSYHSNFEKRYKMGCVVTRNKSPIGIGFNQCKTHPIYNDGKKWYSIHAETSAILKVQFQNLSNCSIYIYRETVNGIPAMAKPCKSCLPLIIEMGIKNIYYTTNQYPYWEVIKL